MLRRRNFLGSVFGSTFLKKWAEGSSARTAAESLPLSWPDDTAPDYWERLRDQFYLRPGEAYFNTGTLGAIPRCVLERVIEDMRTLQMTLTRWDYGTHAPTWFSGYTPELPLRAKIGRLVNADALDIALTQNATFGMNFLANGLDLQPGDEIITTDQEHPGGVCGWQMRAKRHGAICKQVKLPLPANDPDRIVRLFAEAITKRTRVLVFPHVVSSTAVVMPVKALTELAHQHNCLSLVDGAQGVGHVEVDLKALNCDAYFSSPHKWLLAPPGNGFLYIRRDRQDLFWTTLCSAEWDNHQEGAYRFMQYGTGNISLQAGLDAALDFHFRVGPERIRKRIRALADRLRDGLLQIPGVKINSPVHATLAGAVVVYAIEGVPAAQVQDEMWLRKRIRLRAMNDRLGVRQSCHIYNCEKEIDVTLAVVRDLARGA